MDSVKVIAIWIIHLIRGLTGRRKFIAPFPPFARVQRVYNRSSRNWLKFHIRDNDDWIQIEHIFLNEGFDLSATARRREIEQLYRGIIQRGETPLIVDLGANIGLASAYFDLIYPNSDIISVEPSKGNCEIARRNLPPSATLVEAAIASRTGRAQLIETGRNCGFQVDPAEEGDVSLVTVADILEGANGRTPFLIKIDIEGFEEDLFSGNVEWIDRFPVLLIELHDWMLPNRCVTRNFLAAMAARKREFMHFEGYVVSLASPLDDASSEPVVRQGSGAIR